MKSKIFLLSAAFLLIGACSNQKSEPLFSVKSWLLVLNKSENLARILDIESGGDVLEVLVTGVGPHEVALHEGSGVAVVTNYGTRENPGSSLTVIDFRARRVLKTIGLGRFRRPAMQLHPMEHFF